MRSSGPGTDRKSVCKREQATVSKEPFPHPQAESLRVSKGFGPSFGSGHSAAHKGGSPLLSPVLLPQRAGLCGSVLLSK